MSFSLRRILHLDGPPHWMSKVQLNVLAGISPILRSLTADLWRDPSIARSVSNRARTVSGLGKGDCLRQTLRPSLGVYSVCKRVQDFQNMLSFHHALRLLSDLQAD